MRQTLTALAASFWRRAFLAQDEAARTSTPSALATDQPRTPEQLALRIDLADLSIKVIPDDKAIDAVAALTFGSGGPGRRPGGRAGRFSTSSEVSVDGQAVKGWANPEGRMTVPLAPSGGG